MINSVTQRFSHLGELTRDPSADTSHGQSVFAVEWLEQCRDVAVFDLSDGLGIGDGVPSVADCGADGE